MKASPGVIFRVAAVFLLLASPLASGAARRNRDSQPETAAVDPALVAMLGSAVPEWTAVALTSELRVALPSGGEAALATQLTDVSSGGARRFEGKDLALIVRTYNYGQVRLEGAHVLVEPSGDGRSCRFEVSGAPFGPASTLEASGTVTWGTGPLGGHELDGKLRVGGASTEALRMLIPARIDPSVTGPVSLAIQGKGVVGEVTTEDAPATPLRGELELTAGWTVLGRSAPLTAKSTYALDDRMVRLTNGHLKWMDFDLGLSGWFEHRHGGKFDLSAPFANVDTARTAREWNVPAAWVPESTVSGVLRWKGVPGDSHLRYEASAPTIDLPGLGGWSVHLDEVKMSGGILEINTDVNASLSYRTLRVGNIELPLIPGGVQWWREQFSVVTAKTALWKGTHTGSLSYKPAEHPAFLLTGVLTRAEADSVVASLLPDLGLDADGKASMSYAFGQDGSRKQRWTVRGSLMEGRLGNVNVPARVLDALAAADASLALADAASLVPKPKRGEGMAVDRLFFQMAREGEVFDLGGMELDSGSFSFNGDGRWTRNAGLALEGTVLLPAEVTAKLVAAAPWMAALRSAGGGLYVPVTLRGPASAPVLALKDGFADTMAGARRGEAVSPPKAYEYRRVGAADLAGIPGDPVLPAYQ